MISSTDVIPIFPPTDVLLTTFCRLNSDFVPADVLPIFSHAYFLPRFPSNDVLRRRSARAILFFSTADAVPGFLPTGNLLPTAFRLFFLPTSFRDLHQPTVFRYFHLSMSFDQPPTQVFPFPSKISAYCYPRDFNLLTS